MREEDKLCRMPRDSSPHPNRSRGRQQPKHAIQALLWQYHLRAYAIGTPVHTQIVVHLCTTALSWAARLGNHKAAQEEHVTWVKSFLFPAIHKVV